jgi:hypothetical protein
MWFPYALGLFSIVLAAIVFIGGYAEERRNAGTDPAASAI